MKKLLMLVAMAACLTAGTAMAAVQATPHDYVGSVDVSYGQCEVCHVPHAAGTGARLWREVRTITLDATWSGSTVGILCGTCHKGGALQAARNGFNAAPSPQAADAYAATSHGRNVKTLKNNIHDTLTASGNAKPYTDDVTAGKQIQADLIECTSCHEPHQAGLRPFLRPTTEAGRSGTSGFCADCHEGRYTTNVGATNVVTWNLLSHSTHPVNVNYADNAGNGATYFRAAVDPALNKKADAMNKAVPWVLGGKGETATSNLQDGNNIGCGSCHAIHNPAATANDSQSLYLLAIDNTGGAGTAALCQGCHGGPDAGGAGGNSVGAAGTGDHPINTLTSRPGPDVSRWIGAMPDGTQKYERTTSDGTTYWPKATGGGVNIICTSCHSAHGAIAGNDAINGVGKLRRTGFGNVSWCTACHLDAAPVGHHSYDGNWTAAQGGPSAIGCSNCHSGGIAGGLAHNGFSFLFAATANQNSELCATCHGVAATDDPVVAVGTIPNPYLTKSANHTKSHYIGTFAGMNGPTNSINVKRSNWTVAPGINSFSKYGGADTHQKATDAAGTNMICESCHSVRWNIGAYSNGYVGTIDSTTGYKENLLLQRYRDDSSSGGQGAAEGQGSGLCIACHNQKGVAFDVAGTVSDFNVVDATIAPVGMHPMTNWTITRAKDAGRASIHLLSGAGSYATITNLPYPVAGSTTTMDCDSCHTPHLGQDNGTFNTAKTAKAGVSVILENAGPTAGKFDNLCKDCHAY
ncbi:MAG TPA: hypothetical protein VGK71_04810 [Nitrospirota bacterium]